MHFPVLLALIALATDRITSMTMDPRQPENSAILTTLPLELAEVDFIIAGGGTAGSIVAARLSDAHPKASILLIEAGPESFDLPAVAYPALYRKNISPASTTIKFYFAAPDAQLANRSIPILAGRTLGGGSAVNLLMYARGQKADFDGWKEKGWLAEELVPFLRKSEAYHGLGHEATHGEHGPIAVSNGTHVGSTLQKDFMAGFNQIGYPTAPDIQDLETSSAVSATYRIVSPATGRRQDTAYTYLRPRLQQSKCGNLHVLVDTQVLRVLFDEEGRATGVELCTKAGGEVQIVKARKLVILSAGAMGTPQILERSGLGDPKLLESAGVPVVAPLPGVGSEYQDHQMIMVTYKAELPPSENVDSVFNGVLNTTELIQDNAAILSWNGVDTSAKVRPTQAEVDMFKPALRKWWDEYFAHEPSRPLGIIVVYAGVMSVTTAYPTDDRYFTMAAYNPYSRSRGHVHITGPGIDNPLDFRTGMLSDPEETDIQVLVWLYKKQRQVAKRMGCQRGQISPGPVFPANSSISSDPTKDPSKEEDPTFSPDDDEAIEQWIRETVATPFHSLGTCKMAAESEFGVVDNSLNVYGVKGLKIADLSIAPGNVAGNTMNAAVLIGEKAADITIREFLI